MKESSEDLSVIFDKEMSPQFAVTVLAQVAKAAFEKKVLGMRDTSMATKALYTLEKYLINQNGVEEVEEVKEVDAKE